MASTQRLTSAGAKIYQLLLPLHALDVFTSGEYLKRLFPEHAAAQKPFRDEDFL